MTILYDYSNAAAVTTSDSTDITPPVWGFTVGASGNVSVITNGGQTVTIPVIAGFFYPLRVNRFRATGTTATGIVGYW